MTASHPLRLTFSIGARNWPPATSTQECQLPHFTASIQGRCSTTVVDEKVEAVEDGERLVHEAGDLLLAADVAHDCVDDPWLGAAMCSSV